MPKSRFFSIIIIGLTLYVALAPVAVSIA